MPVDLKVILLTMVNFALVLFVLNKFLLKPVLKVMDERQARIDSTLNDVCAKADEAEKRLAEVTRMQEEEHERSEALYTEAVKQAGLQQEELLKQAQTRAQAILAEAKEDISRARDQALRDTQNEIVTLSLSISEQLLQKELSEEKHQELIDSFLNQLEGVES